MNIAQVERRIHLLPEHLIDQIKAGEVIERPANIIKETLENAIDANASLIKIHIVGGGLELIHIDDNGNGMSFDDLPFAFCRHATSKISKFDDLYHLNSFGFRGEALASISAISRVSCYSNTISESTLLQIEGAQTTSHEKLNANGKSGTSLYIRDLFYNTPVRMKFLQSMQGETAKIKKIITSFLLTRADIEFHVKWDDSDKIIYQKSTLLERFKNIIGEKKGLEKKVYTLEENFEEYNLKIVFSAQTAKSAANREQFIFINQRSILDKQIHNLLLRVLAPIWADEQGSYALFIGLNPEEIDVNVHPNKTIVKIHQNSKLLAFIGSSIKKYLKDKSVPTPEQIAGPSGTQENLAGEFFKDLNAKHELSSPSRMHNIFQHNQRQHNQIYYTIDDQFGMFFNQYWYFLDISEFIYYWIVQAGLAQSESVPQMVSWPFQVKYQFDDLEQFKEISGIELDQLDSHTVVLRSLPSYLKEFDYHKIIDFLLSSPRLPQDKQQYLEKLKSVKTYFFQSADFIQDLILSFNSHDLFQQSFIKKMDHSLLNKVFKK